MARVYDKNPEPQPSGEGSRLLLHQMALIRDACLVLLWTVP